MARYTNRLRSTFRVMWEAQNDLEGKITAPHVDNSLQDKVNTKAYRKNRLRATFEAELPSKEVLEVGIVKDTYVTDKTPTLNNGNLEILKVGTDEDGYEYRTLIKPNITQEIKDITQNKYIVKAELVLTSNEQVSFEGMEVSIPSNDWQEYSVVWLGQPSRKRVLYVTNLEKDTYVHTLDLTDIFEKEWILNKSENFGIILKNTDEAKQQLINFSSRESYNPPMFRITYIDKDLFTEEGAVLSGKIKPTYRTHNDCEGRIDVWRDEDSREIKGRVKTHRDDTLEGCIKVAGYNDIKGKIKVKEKWSEINGKMESYVEWVFGKVNIRACNDLYGRVYSQSLNAIRGRINVVYHDDIQGSVIVRPLELYDLDGKLKTSAKTDLEGKIKVIYKNETDGKLMVRQYEDVNGRVRPTVRLDNEIDGILNVILKSQIVGKVSVNQIALPSKIVVRGVDGVNGQLTVSGLSEVEGKIYSAMKSDVDGYVRSRAKEINELNGKLSLGIVPEFEEDNIYIFIM